MLKIKAVVLFFLFLCQTAESKELNPDIQLLIAHGFIKEAKLELIAVARNPANSDPEKIQALLLLDTIASNNTEKKVVLEMLCDIDNKYLPQLKQFEADVLKEKEQEKLAQQRLRDEERAKQYLEQAKFWRGEIVKWRDATSVNSAHELYYEKNELVELMEFCLNQALSLAPGSKVTQETFDFYFFTLLGDLLSYDYSFWKGTKLDAKNFEEYMSKIVNSLEIYETMYPHSTNILQWYWYIHETFYRLPFDRVVPANRDKVRKEFRGFIYYGSRSDLWIRSLDWLDRIMKKSQDQENFYSNMARRKYRFMSRIFSDKSKMEWYFNMGKYGQEMQEAVAERVSRYPVLRIGDYKKQNRNE